jgi:hypothetical protein
MIGGWGKVDGIQKHKKYGGMGEREKEVMHTSAVTEGSEGHELREGGGGAQAFAFDE